MVCRAVTPAGAPPSRPGEPPRGRRRSAVSLAARFESVQRKPQSEHRRIQIPQALFVERARLGDVGEELQGVADVLAGALGRASLRLRTALYPGPALLHHDGDHAAAVGGGAALGRQAAIGVRQLHSSQCGTGLWLQLVIHLGGWRIFNHQTPLTGVGTPG